MKWFLLGMMVSSLSWATVTVEQANCPDEFVSSVKDIVEPLGAISLFSKEKVIFENNKTLDVLMNGPFEIEVGKEYRVQMREDKLCWIELL
jgi:hypothetical protein